MILAILLLGALVGLGLVVSCGKKSGKVVARVGSREITIEDYNQQYLAISSRYRPRKMQTMEAKERFLQDLINKEILASEAWRLGLGDDPNLAMQMKFLTDQAVMTVLRDEEVERRVSVAPGELQEFYERQRERYHVEILGFSDREEAVRAVERTRGGESFADLADESTVRRAYPRADAGEISWGTFQEPLNSIVFGMKAGEVSDPVPMLDNNWAVVRVVEIIPNEDLPSFEDVKNSLVENLKNIKRRERFATWMHESIAKYQVEVDSDVAERVRERLVWDVSASDDPRPELTTEEAQLVLGTFRGGRWTLSDFLDRLMVMPKGSRPDVGMAPKEFVSTVRLMVTNEALLGEGYERGLDQQPGVRKRLDRAREERMVTALYRSIVRDVTVTEEDVNHYYEEYKESLRSPAEYGLSRILTASEEEARSALEEIRAGTSFADVARARSLDSQTALGGGKMSPATTDALPPEVREVAVELKEGEVGGPVETTEGWMVVRLDSYNPERELSLEEARNTILQQLMQTRQGEAFDSWLQEKREELGVEIYEDVLAKIELVADRETPEPGGHGEPEA